VPDGARTVGVWAGRSYLGYAPRMLSLPAQPGPARDAAILSYIRGGNYDVSWSEVTSTSGSHTGTFRVFADALKIEGVRITMSAYLEQTVADMLGCNLLTPRIADLIFAQRAITLSPHTQTPNASMVTSPVMVAQSQWIDMQLNAAGFNSNGIVSTVGKHWCISQLFKTNPATAGKAINYGFHFVGSFLGQTWAPSVSLPGVRVVQNPGWAHADQEVDYSQNCVLVARTCFVDGVSRDIHDILQDPVLSALVSVEGPVAVLRQPGVPVAPFLANPAATPPCVGPGCPTNVSYEPGEAERPSIPLVVAGSIALTATVGGFLGGLALMKKPRGRA
jgi:hypothetical protein